MSVDMWHRAGRIFRLSNLGTFIFFLLNICLLVGIFFPNGYTWEGVAVLALCYASSVLISLSPVGEWLLASLSGAQEIKRQDIKIRLIPLLQIPFEQAKEQTPTMVSSIRLKIIHDQAPNAFAIGRKTICVTDGLLSLTDEDIMAVFAHELGHIAYKHSTIQLLIGGGNLFISGFLLIVKLVCWAITGICALFAIGTRRLSVGLLITALGSISSILIWLWTKFCMLFLMWSMRQNEFIADEYAYKLGYGVSLARVLDYNMCTPPEGGLLKALYSSHPNSNDRIARLQEMGATYSRY